MVKNDEGINSSCNKPLLVYDSILQTWLLTADCLPNILKTVKELHSTWTQQLVQLVCFAYSSQFLSSVCP